MAYAAYVILCQPTFNCAWTPSWGEGRSMNKSPAQRHLRLVIMHVLKRMHDVPAIHRQAYEIFMAGQNLGACIIGILIFEENSVPRVFIANVLLIYICWKQIKASDFLKQYNDSKLLYKRVHFNSFWVSDVDIRKVQSLQLSDNFVSKNSAQI